MPTPLSNLLDELYRNPPVAASLEKTAEDTLAAALFHEGTAVEAEPEPDESEPVDLYATMSTEELARLALELDAGGESQPAEKTASDAAPPEGEEEPPELLQKLAMDAVGGRIMAHAMLHEERLMKVAMAQGLCRVCKENERDVAGSSICSSCQSAE